MVELCRITRHLGSGIATTGRHFVVRADEKLTAFMELESAMRRAAHRAAGEVKLVYGKNINWLLFNPNQLQKFPQ